MSSTSTQTVVNKDRRRKRQSQANKAQTENIDKKRKMKQQGGEMTASSKTERAESFVSLSPSLSCFEVDEITVKLSLPPSCIGNVEAGVATSLNQLLMKYREEIGGVLLAYSRVRLCGQVGHIMDEMPSIHFAVRMRALVFRPVVGAKMVGRVNKIGSNHIGMLVEGVFSASISSNEIQEDYVYNPLQDTWNGPDGQTIGLGDLVTFEIIFLYESAGLISIAGSMRMDEEEEHSASETTSNSSSTVDRKAAHKASRESKALSKKRRRTDSEEDEREEEEEEEEEEGEEENGDGDESVARENKIVLGKKDKKKKKKNKDEENDGDLHINGNGQAEEREDGKKSENDQKKAKKHKKDKKAKKKDKKKRKKQKLHK